MSCPFRAIHFLYHLYNSLILIILNNKSILYNKIVLDYDNVLSKEKYYVNESEMWEIVEECGIDVMGCMVCEFWSKD